jgi:uncharacterized FAD-dependent dehydrogenase
MSSSTTRILLLLFDSTVSVDDDDVDDVDALYSYLTEEGIEIITDVEIEEVFQKNGIKFVTALVNNHNEKKVRTIEAEQLLLATERKQ